MSYYKEQFTTPNGNTFKLELEHDEFMKAPWEECDGHGEVSDWTARDKKPGELVLYSDRRNKRYYDFQGAVRTARAEGWGCSGLTGKETKGERASKAARADFEYLRRWCTDQWHYAWMCVVILNADGEEVEEYIDTLGGVEDDSGGPMRDYILREAKSIAQRLESRQQRDIEKLHRPANPCKVNAQVGAPC